MTDEQRKEIRELREKGLGYVRIGRVLGISENTVRSYCRRHGLSGTNVKVEPIEQKNIRYCRNCGRPVEQTPGRKEKKFCSDKCRMDWWNSHPELVNRKATYEFVCAYCRKPFTAYGNANRKYCSHECFIADRFGGGR